MLPGIGGLNGVFDLWSILRNITIASLQDMARWSFVRRDMEAARGNDWKTRIGIRTPSVANPILSLSGGNQQKVLFARALGTRAPVVLMDDPMRGVDVGTKQEVYEIIRSEAAAGRTFVWYSTEMDEMQFCDRVYVFREGSIVAELSRRRHHAKTRFCGPRSGRKRREAPIARSPAAGPAGAWRW